MPTPLNPALELVMVVVRLAVMPQEHSTMVAAKEGAKLLADLLPRFWVLTIMEVARWGSFVHVWTESAVAVVE